MTCVRSAWLVLGALSVPLENEAAGYFCESLDLGYPAPREVTENRPDQDGADDRTMYMGPRVVTANIHAVRGAGARIDAVASAFAPFMVPSVRPVLHYVLDRPGVAERTLVLRAAGYAWPVAGNEERQIQLQFVAPDPVVRDTATKTSTAWAGSTAGGGRTYNLTFNRVYPAGGGATITGNIVTNGDVPARPLLRIYGPITTPVVTFRRLSDNALSRVPFVAGYQILGGHFVEVDTAAHTAYLDGDRSQSVLASLDWLGLTWPVVSVAPDAATMGLAGDPAGLVTSGLTQAQATWQDGYLT